MSDKRFKIITDFNYLPYCKPCLACCKNENLYLSDDEKLVYGEASKTANGDCHHLLEDGRCDIHDNRPFECRLYPLDLKFIDGKIQWIVWQSCPAVPNIEHDYLLNEISKYENILSEEWVVSYVKHHEKNEPEKYSEMIFRLLKPYKETV